MRRLIIWGKGWLFSRKKSCPFASLLSILFPAPEKEERRKKCPIQISYRAQNPPPSPEKKKTKIISIWAHWESQPEVVKIKGEIDLSCEEEYVLIG